MRDDPAYHGMLETADIPTPDEHKALELEYFNYRQVIGEAIYALTIARPDISAAIIKLSQYSTRPARVHYQALRQLWKYLALTADRGIYYWRKILVPDLPPTPAEACVSATDVLNRIPQTKQPSRLHAYSDSDWGSDREHRRSVSGIALMLGGGVILYKTKYQPTVAGSSTEAEFAAASGTGKLVLYVRSILFELGFEQTDPTVIHEDNRGCLFLANAQKPTKRTRHVAIKQFMIQDWVETDQILMSAIETQCNISDAFTKSLGRIKFYEQFDVLMGRRLPPYVPSWIRPTHPPQKSLGTHLMETHLLSQNKAPPVPPTPPITDYLQLSSLLFGTRPSPAPAA